MILPYRFPGQYLKSWRRYFLNEWNPIEFYRPVDRALTSFQALVHYHHHVYPGEFPSARP